MQLECHFLLSFFTQNAPSRLRFHDGMKRESLWAFLALVSLGALVVMKTSEVVMGVIALKTSEVLVAAMVIYIPFGLSISTLCLCSNTMP